MSNRQDLENSNSNKSRGIGIKKPSSLRDMDVENGLRRERINRAGRPGKK